VTDCDTGNILRNMLATCRSRNYICEMNDRLVIKEIVAFDIFYSSKFPINGHCVHTYYG